MSTWSAESAVAHHPAAALVAGDDWTIDVGLLDQHNVAIDLTGATVMWMLMDSNFRHVFDTADVVITIDPDPTTGMFSIQIPAAKTTTLISGFYNDALRVVDSAGITTTYFTGQLSVMGDPWAVQAAPANATVVPFQRTLEQNREFRLQRPASRLRREPASSGRAGPLD